MDWQEILTILVPLLGLMGWVYSRIEKKADERLKTLEKTLDKRFESIDKRFEAIDRKFDQVLLEIKEVRNDVQHINSRVSRIEGQLAPRYWDMPKEKNMDTKKPSVSS